MTTWFCPPPDEPEPRHQQTPYDWEADEALAELWEAEALAELWAALDVRTRMCLDLGIVPRGEGGLS
jgi:hypothetical protein